MPVSSLCSWTNILSFRQIHSHLNRLIITRIPLALPPYANTSQIYAQGLLHVAQIYLSFEYLWPHIAEISSQQEPNRTDVKVQNILEHIHLQGLQRSARLRADLRTLLKINDDTQLDLQLLAVANNVRLKEFLLHIQQVVKSKSHVLVAYAWVMYMAIFSGGRWIRSQLQAAPPDFWQQGQPDSPQSALPNEPHPGLEFFYFDGKYDGEDIKAGFKQRLAEVEVLLTPEEKDDIVAEAQDIFRFIIRLVGELDDQLAFVQDESHETGLLTVSVGDIKPPIRTLATSIIPPEKTYPEAEPPSSVSMSWSNHPYTKLGMLCVFILLVILNRNGFFFF